MLLHLEPEAIFTPVSNRRRGINAGFGLRQHGIDVNYLLQFPTMKLMDRSADRQPQECTEAMDLPEETEPLRRTTETHETWVDKLIVDADERGLFNNLPGAGKPLNLERAPYAGERELGYGILKNAGFAPLWVEIDKGIRADLETMNAIRERAREVAQSRFTKPPVRPTPIPEKPGLLRRFFGLTTTSTGSRPIAGDSAQAELNSLRRDYLARAEKLDKQIELFNATVPRDLWWVERPRLTPDQAASDFDNAIVGPSAMVPI